MGKTSLTSSISKPTTSCKRSRKKLSGLEARMAPLEILHREFQALRELLEFSQQQVKTLTAVIATLREFVKSLTEGMT